MAVHAIPTEHKKNQFISQLIVTIHQLGRIAIDHTDEPTFVIIKWLFSSIGLQY